MDNDWISRLKVSDSVVVVAETPHNIFRYVDIVTKTTATQIVITRDRRFYRKDGRLVGNGRYGKTYLEEATTENLNIIADDTLRRSIVTYLQVVDFSRLSLEQLLAIKKIVEPIGKGDLYNGNNDSEA